MVAQDSAALTVVTFIAVATLQDSIHRIKKSQDQLKPTREKFRSASVIAFLER